MSKIMLQYAHFIKNPNQNQIYASYLLLSHDKFGWFIKVKMPHVPFWVLFFDGVCYDLKSDILKS